MSGVKWIDLWCFNREWKLQIMLTQWPFYGRKTMNLRVSITQPKTYFVSNKDPSLKSLLIENRSSHDMGSFSSTGRPITQRANRAAPPNLCHREFIKLTAIRSSTRASMIPHGSGCATTHYGKAGAKGMCLWNKKRWQQTFFITTCAF